MSGQLAVAFGNRKLLIATLDQVPAVVIGQAPISDARFPVATHQDLARRCHGWALPVRVSPDAK